MDTSDGFAAVSGTLVREPNTALPITRYVVCSGRIVNAILRGRRGTTIVRVRLARPIVAKGIFDQCNKEGARRDVRAESWDAAEECSGFSPSWD